MFAVWSYWIPVLPCLTPQGETSKLDYGITLASALAYFINRQRDAVGLITFDDKVNNYIPAKCRQPHLMHILRTLAQIKPGKKTDSVKPLIDLAASLNKKSMVILITDMLDDEDRLIKTSTESARNG